MHDDDDNHAINELHMPLPRIQNRGPPSGIKPGKAHLWPYCSLGDSSGRGRFVNWIDDSKSQQRTAARFSVQSFNKHFYFLCWHLSCLLRWLWLKLFVRFWEVPFDEQVGNSRLCYADAVVADRLWNVRNLFFEALNGLNCKSCQFCGAFVKLHSWVWCQNISKRISFQYKCRKVKLFSAQINDLLLVNDLIVVLSEHQTSSVRQQQEVHRPISNTKPSYVLTDRWTTSNVTKKETGF